MLSGSQDRFSYMAFASDLDTDGYRHNNALHAKDLLGNFSFDVNDSLKLNLSTGLHGDSYGQPGALYWSALRQGIVDPKDSTHPNDTASTNDNFFDFVPEIKLRDDVVLSLGASYRDRHTGSFYDYGFGSYYDAKSQLQTYAFTPKMVVYYPDRRHEERLRHRLGLRQVPHDGKLVGPVLPGPSQSTSDINKRDFAGYADEKIYPLQDLALEAGYRRQKSTFDVDYKDFVNPALSQVGTSSYDRDAYRLSANYAILDKANVFASYSKGFRFPTTDEFVVYGYSPAPGVFVPTQLNTSLKPQTTEEFDLGIRSNPWHRVAGAFTYFQSRNRDEIYFNPLTSANENYDRTKRQGVESTLFFNLATGLTLNLAYSYTEALFDGGQFGGNRIPLVPENKASAKLSYAISNWTFSLASVYTGERYAISDQANAQEQLPGYTTFDTSVGYRWDRLSALLTVKNLTNKRYSEIRGLQPLCQRYCLVSVAGTPVFPHPEVCLWRVRSLDMRMGLRPCPPGAT